jgi:hypothetical protein
MMTMIHTPRILSTAMLTPVALIVRYPEFASYRRIEVLS